MRFTRSAVAVLLAVAFLSTSANLRSVFSQGSSAAASVIDGFSAEGSAEQRRWEEEFRSVPAPASAREHLRILDLGAGTARIPIELSRCAPNFEITAVDAAESMLALASTTPVGVPPETV